MHNRRQFKNFNVSHICNIYRWKHTCLQDIWTPVYGVCEKQLRTQCFTYISTNLDTFSLITRNIHIAILVEDINQWNDLYISFHYLVYAIVDDDNRPNNWCPLAEANTSELTNCAALSGEGVILRTMPAWWWGRWRWWWCAVWLMNIAVLKAGVERA